MAFFWVAPVLAAQLHDVESMDPVTFVTLSLAFLAIGMLSSWLSSQRVAGLDPALTLHAE